MNIHVRSSCYVRTDVYAYIYLYIHIYIYILICIYVYTYINMCTYVYIYTYMCIYTAGKWQKCNLVSGHGLCGQPGSDIGWLWTGWIDPAPVQMSRMLSGRRAVVILCGLLQGSVAFSLTLSFLREQSPWSFSGLDSCVLAYCGSAAPLLSLQSFYNYARGYCETARSFFRAMHSVHLISVEQ